MADDFLVGDIDAVLRDTAGNPVAVILDNSIYRLEARSTLAGQIAKAGAEQKVTVIADVDEPSTQTRLQTEARIAPNSRVSIVPVGIGEEDLGNLFRQFLTDDGLPTGNSSMIVNASLGSPQTFTFPTHATLNTVLTEVRFTFTALSLGWGGSDFGKGGGSLANGVKIEMTANNGSLVDFGAVTINEEFLMLPVRTSVVMGQSGNRDVLALSIDLGGLAILEAGTADEIKVTIQDNLTSGTRDINYFKFAAYGVRVTP